MYVFFLFKLRTTNTFLIILAFLFSEDASVLIEASLITRMSLTSDISTCRLIMLMLSHSEPRKFEENLSINKRPMGLETLT